MLSKFFKKDNPFDLDEAIPTENLEPVQHIDEESQKSKTIYYLPKDAIAPNEIVFKPSDWNIRRFQIGRHLGRGK